MWPWRHRQASAERLPPAEHMAPRDEWRTLPPIQRSLTAQRLVNPVERFRASLGTWQDPRFLTELGHAVGPDEPAGLIDAGPPTLPVGAVHATRRAARGDDHPATVARSVKAVTTAVSRMLNRGSVPAVTSGSVGPPASGPASGAPTSPHRAPLPVQRFAASSSVSPPYGPTVGTTGPTLVDPPKPADAPGPALAPRPGNKPEARPTEPSLSPPSPIQPVPERRDLPGSVGTGPVDTPDDVGTADVTASSAVELPLSFPRFVQRSADMQAAPVDAGTARVAVPAGDTSSAPPSGRGMLPVEVQRTLGAQRSPEHSHRLGLGEPILMTGPAVGDGSGDADVPDSADVPSRPTLLGTASAPVQPTVDMPQGVAAPTTEDVPHPEQELTVVPTRSVIAGETAGPSAAVTPERSAAPPPLTVARLIGDRPQPLATAASARPASPPTAPGPVTPTVDRRVTPAGTPMPDQGSALAAPVAVQRDRPPASDVPAASPQAITLLTAAAVRPADAIQTVQRQADPADAAAGPSAPVPAPAVGGEPEDLLEKVYDPLLRRLKADLRIDRDRCGSLTDLRR